MSNFNQNLCGRLSILAGNDPDMWAAEAASYRLVQLLDIDPNIGDDELKSKYELLVESSVECLKQNLNNTEANFVCLYAMGSELYSELIARIEENPAHVSIRSMPNYEMLRFVID